MAVFIPDIFSGYMQGMRAAVQDNWKDLQNYNQVQRGQLENAFSMGSFDPAMRNVWNKAMTNEIAALLAAKQAELTLPYLQGMSNYGVPDLQAQAARTAAQYQIQYPGGVTLDANGNVVPKGQLTPDLKQQLGATTQQTNALDMGSTDAAGLSTGLTPNPNAVVVDPNLAAADELARQTAT